MNMWKYAGIAVGAATITYAGYKLVKAVRKPKHHPAPAVKPEASQTETTQVSATTKDTETMDTTKTSPSQDTVNEILQAMCDLEGLTRTTDTEFAWEKSWGQVEDFVRNQAYQQVDVKDFECVWSEDTRGTTVLLLTSNGEPYVFFFNQKEQLGGWGGETLENVNTDGFCQLLITATRDLTLANRDGKAA